MPARVWHNPPNARAPKSLAIRGGLVRTFGGLASFLVVTFLCAGFYILEDAVANPIAAQAAALIFGAFIIALATILLFYLIRPESGPRTSRREQTLHLELLPPQELLEEAPVTSSRESSREGLVYQRVYKDHSRIRL
jgi:hypothetical protein